MFKIVHFLATSADDTQLYRHCLRTETAATVARLVLCLLDVSHWMLANRLKLNPEKTKLLWAGSKYSRTLPGSSGLSLQIQYRYNTIQIQCGYNTDHVRVQPTQTTG